MVARHKCIGCDKLFCDCCHEQMFWGNFYSAYRGCCECEGIMCDDCMENLAERAEERPCVGCHDASTAHAQKLQAKNVALEARVAEQDAQIADQDARIAEQHARIAELEAALAGQPQEVQSPAH